MAETQTSAHTEVPAQEGGLPQLNVIADGSYTNQIFWLVVTFVALYIVVSRFVLPRVGSVIENREEQIRSDLDKAEKDRKDIEEISANVETILADARSKAQTVLADAKSAIQDDMSKAVSAIDAEIEKRVSAAEAEVSKAREAALADIETVAAEVATDIVSRLAGVDADGAAVSAAVKASLADTKEAQ